MADRFQVLSLPGGGFMGYHTALMIDHIERKIINPNLDPTDSNFKTIGQHFDLICGTSIGGIIGLAVSFNIPAAILVRGFQEYGHKIFTPRELGKWACIPKMGKIVARWKAYRHNSIFSPTPLVEAINYVFNEAGLGQADELAVKDSPNKFIFLSHNITSGMPKAFKTMNDPTFTFDQNISIVDIALATSAVPCVFPPHEIQGQLFADGAMYANSPAVCGIAEAIEIFEQNRKNIHILEICPGDNPLKLGGIKKEKVDGLSWLFGNDEIPAGLVVSQVMGAQQQSAGFITKYLIGDDNYTKITSKFTSLTSEQVNLIKADEKAQRAIENEAQTTFDHEVYKDKKVKAFFLNEASYSDA